MTTNIETQNKENTDLSTVIDSLDGKIGEDSTGMESQILSKIFNLDAEKKEETIKRMISLREVEMKLQSGYQKRNLLA